MNYKGIDYRTVWWENSTLKLINQPKLPFEFKVISSSSHLETADHIRKMTVRGAPAIGAAGAFGMVQGLMEHGIAAIKTIKNDLLSTRPTARDLYNAVEFIEEAILATNSIDSALNSAEKYADTSVEECRSIGRFGADLINNEMNILTHCNAGWLACVDWGTALAPIYAAHRNGINLHVWVDETRPRLQGARLTAWELHNEDIAHTIIADNAAAYLMADYKVDIVITGADRVAFNGDAANKIGTLAKAICAKKYDIPFYIAIPKSTIDKACLSGNDIVIEERNSDEVSMMSGFDYNSIRQTIRVSNPGSDHANPAFDITPAELITGYITPDGIIPPQRIPELIPN